MATQPSSLAEAITASGLTRQHVADELGISRNFLDGLVAKHAAIPRKHHSRLADLLGVSEGDVAVMSHHPVPLVGRRLAFERGLTITDLHQALGLSYYRTTAGLAGHRPFPAHAAAKLAELLDRPVELVVEPDTELVQT